MSIAAHLTRQILMHIRNLTAALYAIDGSVMIAFALKEEKEGYVKAVVREEFTQETWRDFLKRFTQRRGGMSTDYTEAAGRASANYILPIGSPTEGRHFHGLGI